MLKFTNTYKGFLNPQSEFDHRYACWALNHRGWPKMKKYNKRVAKRRKRAADRDYDDWQLYLELANKAKED